MVGDPCSLWCRRLSRSATSFSMLFLLFRFSFLAMAAAASFAVPAANEKPASSMSTTKDLRGRLPKHNNFHAFAAGEVERVYCLSDLHTDHPANFEWLQDRMKQGPPVSSSSSPQKTWSSKDLLVIAGDISHSLDVLERTLLCLREPGCPVLFVAGNHEAWLEKTTTKRDKEHPPPAPINSLDKIDRVYEVCRNLGVMVDPCFLPAREGGISSRNSGGSDSSSLWIVPLQSWYDGSLGFAPELERGFESWPWVDFARCTWPDDKFPLDGSRIPRGLVDYWLEGNRPLLDLASSAPTTVLASEDDRVPSVMTVSHFLPNFQSLPDWKDLSSSAFDMEWLNHGAGEMSAKFAKVAGSAKIDEQIRSLRHRQRRQIHVFGHSHRPKDFEHNGIRYVHNPLGKPRERELQLVSPNVDFQLLWDFGTTLRSESEEAAAEVPGPQILRYWDEMAGGKEALWERIERSRRSMAPTSSSSSTGESDGRYSKDLPMRTRR